MRRSIATVSLSGPLNEKLVAAAAAGFDGVEIFDQDLITSMWSPARVRERCTELGLRIEMLQPFRDLEGMTREEYARALRRFRGKLDIMEQLGTDLVLVCASCQSDAIDDDELSAEQLYRAAELAHERGMRIAFEALAWSTHVWDYRRSWNIVKLADHPALGVCQDTFHVLSRGLDPAGIREIPGEKIFFVQLSDAPQLAMDILQWSRHYRVWPGQGSWDVVGFLEHCLAAGYSGPLSLEIFNTVFRRADASRNAADAMRSLLYVEDAVAQRARIDVSGLDKAPPVPTVNGFDFVEVAVLEHHQRVASALQSLGFVHTGTHRDKPIELWEQGKSRILLHSVESARARQTGPHIAALGLHTADPYAARLRGHYLRATASAEGGGPEDTEAVGAPDGTAVFFTQLTVPEHWRAAYDPVDGHDPGVIVGDVSAHIDGVTLAQPFDRFDEATLFFSSVLGLETHEDVEIPATYGLFRSRSVANDDRSVRITTTVALLDDAAVEIADADTGELRRDIRPAAVVEDESRKNCIAVEVDDIFAACEQVLSRGGELLTMGHNYYVDLAGRTDLDDITLERMERLGIVYDRLGTGTGTGTGTMFQAFTPMIGNRLYLELCQRDDGYDSYGTANAPVRISAHRGTTPGLATRAADER